MSNRPLEPTTGRWGHCSHEAFRLARGGSTAYTLASTVDSDITPAE